MVFPIRGPHSPPVNFYFSVEHLMKVISYVRILALALAGAGAYAQPLPPGAVIVASGLDNPRGLRFGRGNQLFVAEAGTGGSNSTIGTCDAQVPFPLGPLRGGLTGVSPGSIRQAKRRRSPLDCRRRFPAISRATQSSASPM